MHDHRIARMCHHYTGVDPNAIELVSGAHIDLERVIEATAAAYCRAADLRLEPLTASVKDGEISVLVEAPERQTTFLIRLAWDETSGSVITSAAPFP